MSDGPLFNQKFRHPLITFADLLTKEAGGAYVEHGEYIQFMFRAYVYAIDTEGARLQNPTGKTSKPLTQSVTDSEGTREFVVKPTRGQPNPPDSVKARIIGSSIDQFVIDDDLRVYWPLFPGVSNPTPGELVYVVFEDASMTHGLWIAKVPFDNRYDNTNNVLLREVSKDVSKDTLASNYQDSQNMTSEPTDPISREGSSSNNDLFSDG